MYDASIFADRRKRLMEKMNPNSIAIIPAAPEARYSNDTDYRYRPDSDLYYLTGFKEPGACAIISTAHDKAPFKLFVRPRDKAMEIWNGYRAGTDGALETYRADEAFINSELFERLGGYMEDRDTIYFFPGRYPDWDSKILGLWQKTKLKWRNGIDTPKYACDLAHLLHEIRLIKTPHEIALMRDACRISAEAHELAIRTVKPGMSEKDIQALIEHYFLSAGADGPGFATICASGTDACILHYISNEKDLVDGDLLCVDAGCEYQMFNGDITRTYPINGKFNAEQRAVYDVVLAANKEIIEKTVVGSNPHEMQELAIRILTEGAKDLGLIEMSVDEAIEKEEFKKFYMHRIGHWLGMDVHDVGSSRSNGTWRNYENGMIVTVEPGIYVPIDDDAFPANFRGIGVRVEDDILITDDGPENLTSMCPKEAGELEELIGSKSSVTT